MMDLMDGVVSARVHRGQAGRSRRSTPWSVWTNWGGAGRGAGAAGNMRVTCGNPQASGAPAGGREALEFQRQDSDEESEFGERRTGRRRVWMTVFQN